MFKLRSVSLMTITLGVIWSCGTVLAQGKEMALFLLIGQSNTAGRGAIKEPGKEVGLIPCAVGGIASAEGLKDKGDNLQKK